MRSLRAQLILSHVLPQLLILPLLSLSLVYIIESQILLVGLAGNLTSVALAAAQNATASPAIWQDSARAADFVRGYSESLQREVILLRPDGGLQAAPPGGDAATRPQLAPGDLEALMAGQALVHSRYSLSLDANQVQALAPVKDAHQVVVGIVEVTDRLGNLYANFQTIRNLEIAATLLALLVAVGMGVWLARRTEARLLSITAAVEQVARSGTEGSGAVTGGAVAGGAVTGEAPDGAERAVPKPMPRQMPPEFSRVLAAVSDLSERLRASEQARRLLLVNLVHEVARPLGALQAAVHALQKGAANEPGLRGELLQGMDDQIERLKPLLDNLASLYTMSDRPAELQRAPVALGEWLPKVLVTWQAAARGRGLDWQEDLPPGLPVVAMDADRMAQALGNLAANAIQYTPEGGQVRVSAGVQAGRAWVAVEDTGIGISEEERQRIFEPFYRGPRARRFPQGMGLGLAITAEIVALHGGELQVDSEVGRGSRFTIWLPA